MIGYRDGAVDLRSDQITKPSRAMREMMASAEVGNDIYGEDPTVNALEEKVADLLGKEAAVFVPSGTMANQIAIALHTRPGDSVLIEENTHCYLYESGGAAALNGVQFEVLGQGQLANPAEWKKFVRPEAAVYATTSLVVLENTHNVGAGRSTSRAETDKIACLALDHGMTLHLDGARLWNAAVALNTTERELAAPAKTVAVCFSKSLCAPVGSAIAGPAALMQRARKLKKRFGGGMCQAGIVAAGALFALESDYRAQLQKDRTRLKVLVDKLSDLGEGGVPLAIQCPEPHSNICFFRHDQRQPEELERAFADSGVLIHHMRGGWMRIVTHGDLSDTDIERTLAILDKVLRT